MRPFIISIITLWVSVVATASGPDDVVKQDRPRKGRPPSSQPDAKPRQGPPPEMMNRKAPKVGEKATDFTLATFDGKQSLTMSKSHQDRPLVLVFGSFT